MKVLRTIVFGCICNMFFLPMQAMGQGGATSQVTTEERASVVFSSIERLNEMYIFPDIARKIEKALRARASKGEYSAIVDPQAFALRLTTDLQTISNDRHLLIDYFHRGAPETHPAWQQSPERLQQLRDFGAKTNFGFAKAECLPGNIGYIDIRSFLPLSMAAETASAAMSMIAYTDALILDLRNNSGGSPTMMAFVASYLFDEPTRLSDIYERLGSKTRQWWTMPVVPGLRFGSTKPVYILTSAMTFSAAEAIAYDLKSLQRAKVIGETTAGGAHPKRLVKVSEHFAIHIPFARAINPNTRTNWEGTGVTPDIAAPANQALEQAYRAALRDLIKASTDEGRKAALQGLLDER